MPAQSLHVSFRCKHRPAARKIEAIEVRVFGQDILNNLDGGFEVVVAWEWRACHFSVVGTRDTFFESLKTLLHIYNGDVARQDCVLPFWKQRPEHLTGFPAGGKLVRPNISLTL